MYLQLTDEDIYNIREEKFPSVYATSFKNVVVKNSGTDNIIDFALNISDYVGDPDIKKPKVFGNSSVKNSLKVKIFEINSKVMKDELINLTSIEEIEQSINKYGTTFVDLFACTDFIGDKKDAKAHNLDNQNVILTYKNRLILPRQEIGFLSLGIIFYFDFKTYVKESGIPENFINKKSLTSNLKIVDLFDYTGELDSKTDNISENINPDVVQDLRTVNKIFKQNDILDKLNEKSNFDIKITKIFSNKEKNIDNTPFFSSLFHSRDTKGNLNFAFNFDYKKIVENYSSFKKIIQNSSFPSDIYEKCFISSLKIVRRELDYNKHTNKKPVIRKTPAVCVVQTSQSKKINEIFLLPQKNKSNTIRELNIFPDCRTVEVTDSEIYKSKNAFHQYGVEIKIDDGFSQYLKTMKETLSSELITLKNYYRETENFIKPQLLERQNSKLTVGYYDPITNSFTRRFAEEIFPIIYEEKIIYCISNFVAILKILGIVDDKQSAQSKEITNLFDLKKGKVIKKVDQDELVSSLVSLLSPASAEAETISYFIKIYEKIIIQLERVLKTNYNTSFEVDYWFEKDLFDASEHPSIGYGFFEEQQAAFSLPRITNSLIQQKAVADIFHFSNTNTLDEKADSIKFASFSPMFINVMNKKINLMDLTKISDIDFIDLELSIKRYNSQGKDEKEIILEDSVESLPPKEQEIKLKNIRHLERFSNIIKNRFIDLADNIKATKLASENTEKENQSINPNILFVGMLKNTHKTPKFNGTKQVVKVNSKAGLLPANLEQNFIGFVPYQVSYLIQKKDKLFSPNNIKYLTDLNNNSKFLLLYNTIHKVEVLQKGKNIRDENWTVLTKEVYDQLQQNNSYICRLVNYHNPSLGVDSFEEVSLPIYHKHFILQKIFSDKQIKDDIDFIKKKYGYFLPVITQNVILNTVPKILIATPVVQKIEPQKTAPVKLGAKPLISEQTPKLQFNVPNQLSGFMQKEDLLLKSSNKLGAVVQPSIVEKNNSSKPPTVALQDNLVNAFTKPVAISTTAIKNESLIKQQDLYIKTQVAPSPKVENIAASVQQNIVKTSNEKTTFTYSGNSAVSTQLNTPANQAIPQKTTTTPEQQKTTTSTKKPTSPQEAVKEKNNETRKNSSRVISK